MATSTPSAEGARILLSLEQVRQKLGISRWTLYRVINRNELRTVRIGTRRLVHPDQLQRYLAWLMQQETEDGR